MAKTNPIDSINIKNVKYDFDPTELSSLTVTGNLTVNGTTATFNNITADTANLSVIKSNRIEVNTTSTLVISAANIVLSTISQNKKFYTMSYDSENKILYITSSNVLGG